MSHAEWLVVDGIRLATVEAGIKYPNRKDLVLLEQEEGGAMAGVFTQNRFCAAPVQVAIEHLAESVSGKRYLLINTGYANAGTGAAGLEDCYQTLKLAAKEAGVPEQAVLPFSTGVIGERFPVPAFATAMPALFSSLDAHGWGAAAEGIMTTDTRPKLCSRRIEVEGVPVTITGMAKGSGMIKPNMATMLGFIATDAPVAQGLLQDWLTKLSDQSFNRVTVDGDTSTNDACILMATAKAALPVVDESTRDSEFACLLYQALEQVFIELAQSLVRDGEGATKFVEISVTESESDLEARAVAEAVAHSPLVKTALFASDPNWGRILAAVGRAPVRHLDVEHVNIWLGDVQIVERGGLAASYSEEKGAAVMAQEDISIHISLGQGQGSSTVWTCDFSYDYVKINAEYRT